MKINITQIPPEGTIFEEEASALKLDVQTGEVRFSGPIKIRADVSKITNTVTVDLDLSAKLRMDCCRCLNELEIDFKKNLALHYPVSRNDLTIDLDPDIRQEIILDYPMKPLCQSDCMGLCPKCGKNLNKGGCSCGIT